MPFPVDEKHLQAAEQELGRKLPAELRQRLLRSNGGDVIFEDDVWGLFPVFDPSDEKRKKHSAEHILLQTKAAREQPSFPQGAIALADNGSGDKLVLRPGQEAVERWSQQTGELRPLEIIFD